MKKIRRGTFETNSSSTHSIVIPRKRKLPTPTGDEFTFETGWYQWEFANYNFADYLWTAILQLDNYYYKNEGKDECIYVDSWSKKEYKVYSINTWKEKIRSILSPYYTDIIFKMPKIEYYGEDGEFWDYSDCSIDHVSETIELLDKLYNDEELLLNSILYGEVFTGNDNSYEDERIYDEDIREYEDDEDNYYVYYKGN